MRTHHRRIIHRGAGADHVAPVRAKILIWNARDRFPVLRAPGHVAPRVTRAHARWVATDERSGTRVVPSDEIREFPGRFPEFRAHVRDSARLIDRAFLRFVGAPDEFVPHRIRRNYDAYRRAQKIQTRFLRYREGLALRNARRELTRRTFRQRDREIRGRIVQKRAHPGNSWTKLDALHNPYHPARDVAPENFVASERTPYLG